MLKGGVTVKREYISKIEEDIIDKFSMALQLTGEKEDYVIEEFMKSYITRSFSNIAASLSGRGSDKISFEYSGDENYGKALRKISKWANKPSQINHKIVRAYLQLADEYEVVSYEALQRRCNDKDNYPDVYTSTFGTNFAQMKFDGDKSHGKVFEVTEDGIITLWAYVEAEIMRYKDAFTIHSTDYGYVNRNEQMNIGRTDTQGTDHLQMLYRMKCQKCGHEYHANGSDIFQKKCPNCQGGIDTGK